MNPFLQRLFGGNQGATPPVNPGVNPNQPQVQLPPSRRLMIAGLRGLGAPAMGGPDPNQPPPQSGFIPHQGGLMGLGAPRFNPSMGPPPTQPTPMGMGGPNLSQNMPSPYAMNMMGGPRRPLAY